MKRIFVGILALILLFSAAMPVQALATQMGAPAQERPLPDPNAGAYVPAPTKKPAATKVPVPNVSLPGWGAFHIDADTVHVRLPLFNPEANKGWYDLTFAFWVALPTECIAEDAVTQLVQEKDQETGETTEVLYVRLLQSGTVAAGLYLQNVTLSQPVPPGLYSAFVQMQPYFVESGAATMVNGQLKIKLYATAADE